VDTEVREKRLRGCLIVDYVRNTVSFMPLFKGDSFQLPLAPLDVDIAMALIEYGKIKPKTKK